MANTKIVRITLAALTRVEYSEIVEVPVNMTDEELDALVDMRYDQVDGGEYTDDSEYWERSDSCGFEQEDACEDSQPSKRVQRLKGKFVVTDI